MGQYICGLRKNWEGWIKVGKFFRLLNSDWEHFSTEGKRLGYFLGKKGLGFKLALKGRNPISYSQEGGKGTRNWGGIKG